MPYPNRVAFGWIFLLCFMFTGCEQTKHAAPLVLAGESIAPEILDQGHSIYRQQCARCHGMKGDGRTTAMRGPHPPPDLRKGVYKFHSVAQGGLPLDRDLRETIRKGLGGDRMPAYDFLSDSDLNAVVQFVKSLAPRWSQEPRGKEIQVPQDPWPAENRAEAVARGHDVYHRTARCWTCHPSYSKPTPNVASPQSRTNTAIAPIRPNPSQSVPIITENGTIMPPDLRTADLALGCDLERQVRSIAIGIHSAGMPGFHEVMTPKDLWATGYYTQSLCSGRISGH